MSSFNSSGSYFGDTDFGDVHQNPSGLMQSKAKAILYLFQPFNNQFRDVGLRPFQYNFDENFFAATQEINDLSKRNAASSSMMIDNLMTQQNLNDHILPSDAPTMLFRASQLQDSWRFILILTQAANDLSLGNTFMSSASPSSQMRRIYTGYFVDEPYNPGTFVGGRRTLNPNAFMVITHKTVVGVQVEHGRFGAMTSLNTVASEEIVHPQISRGLTATGMQDNRMFLMTPENCVNSIDGTDDGLSIAIPGAHSDITHDKGANIVHDVLEQPAHNVAQIVKGMIKYQDEMSHRHRLSTRRMNNMFDDAFLDQDAHRMKLARHMALPRSRREGIFDLDVDDRISPVQIDNMVGGELEIIPFDNERPMYYETADQEEVSVTNKYSFLIASVVSPILNSAGINDIIFAYEIQRTQGIPRQNFIVASASPSWPVPENDLRSMVKAVEMELVGGIFATIYNSKGDFRVEVSANATGFTSVRLSLIGQGYKCQVPFELPSFMGGLITPLIGDVASNTSNSMAIEGLYAVSTGSAAIGTPFNEDDQDFIRHVEQLTYDDGGEEYSID